MNQKRPDPELPASIFQLLFERAVDPFYLHRRGELLLVNQAACDALGYTRDELMQLTIQDIEAGFDAAQLHEMWERWNSGDTSPGILFGVHRRKDGSTFPVEVHSSRVPLPNGEWLNWALVRDISERREMEAELERRAHALQASLRRTTTILEHMDDALIAVTPAEEIDVYNPAFLRLYDRRDDLGHARIDDVLPADLVALVRGATGERVVQRGEVALPNDGVGAAAASTILSDEGEVLGTVVLVRDVTRQREIDRMKSEFTQMVTHELRTPMTSVLGFAKVTRKRLAAVLEHVPEDDRRAQRAAATAMANLEIIVEEGQRLTALINDVLDFAKMEAGHMELDVDAHQAKDIVGQAILRTESLFHGSPVELRTEVDRDLPDLQVDRDRILQVLLNLLSNAQKFTDEGEVVLAAKHHPNGVEFSVTDTGSGIPANQLDQVFEKFRQVKRKGVGGTGLGLAICREIVQMHCGDITVESEVGRGSRFSFTIPVQGA